MRPTHLFSQLVVLAAASHLSACTLMKDDGPSEPNARQEATRDAPTATPSPRPNLQWKRYAAFEGDLARALDLTPETLCLEFGKAPCIRKVHMVPLGGHEPFDTGMLEPAAEPLATTPTVVDRIMLSACSNRLDLDVAGPAKVFKGFDLSGVAPAPTAVPVRALIVDLYRRLLARDPTDDEVGLVASLAQDDAGKAVSAADFAKLACFTIGTSTEFLFF